MGEGAGPSGLFNPIDLQKLRPQSSVPTNASFTQRGLLWHFMQSFE
jgi:hypothetical protein